MSASGEIKKVFELEKKYPISDWVMNGVHIWPIIRAQIGQVLYKASLSNDSKTNVDHKETLNSKLLGYIKNMSIKKFYYAFKSYRSLKKRIKNINILIGTNSRLDVEINDERFNKIADSIFIKFKEEENCNPIILVNDYNGVYKNQTISNIENKLYVKEIQYVIGVINRVKKRLSKSNYRLPDFDKFLGEPVLREWGAEFNIRTLDIIAGEIQLLSKFYEYLLRNSSISEAYFSPYYEYDKYALILACNNLGIQTWDVQHGVAGDAHMNYTSLRVIPERGFNILPLNYWCWDQASADTITNWKNPIYKSYNNGNPWLDLWGNNKIEELFNLRLPASLVKELKNSYVILIGLQNTRWPIPDVIIRLAQMDLGFNLLFLFRLHPNQNNYSELAETIKNTKNKVFFKEASYLPLNLFLPLIDLHITGFSSVALEAAYYNKPTIFWDVKGLDFFKKSIDESLLTTISNEVENDFRDYIKKQYRKTQVK